MDNPKVDNPKLDSTILAENTVVKLGKGIVRMFAATVCVLAVGLVNFDIAPEGEYGNPRSVKSENATTFISSANAQAPARPQTRRVKTLSREGGPVYTQAFEAYDAEQYDTALSHLNKIINGSGYSDYDKGRALEMRAFIYSDRGDYNTAVRDLKAAITPSDRLNSEEVLRLRYALAQLYLATNNYTAAISEFERWFSSTPEPPAQAYMQFAQAYVLVGQVRKALPYAEKGFAMLTEPNENWYRLMGTIYLQLQQYSKAVPVLEKTVTFWPTNKDYFSQLAYCYSNLNREDDYLAVLALAYDNGLLKSDGDIVRLAQLYRAKGYPYKSAKILTKGMEAGQVKKNKKNWEELGYAWAQAREHKRAVQPLTNAASQSKDGELYFQLCQTFFSDENWSKATSTCRNALNKGVKPTYKAVGWMLIGNAEYKLSTTATPENRDKKREAALNAFERCQQVTGGDELDETLKGCRSWVGFINSEIDLEKREAQRAQLEKELAAERQKEQEEQVRRVLEQQSEFRDALDAPVPEEGAGEETPASP